MKYLAPIAFPVASIKLCPKVLKLCKKATKAKQVKRGVKEVVKAIRKKQKGWNKKGGTKRGTGKWELASPRHCNVDYRWCLRPLPVYPASEVANHSLVGTKSRQLEAANLSREATALS